MRVRRHTGQGSNCFLPLVWISLLVGIWMVTSIQCTLHNHQLLKKIGLQPIKVQHHVNHHQKRLAVAESRRHHSARSDDSHMFVIKLPPHPHYYSRPQFNSIHSNSGSSKIISKRLPLGFRSNGRPAKIYHWNLPILNNHLAAAAKSRLVDSAWNNVLEQRTAKRKKSIKPSYYAPVSRKSQTFTTKYIMGNGKPHAFYIYGKNSKAYQIQRFSKSP